MTVSVPAGNEKKTGYKSPPVEPASRNRYQRIWLHPAARAADANSRKDRTRNSVTIPVCFDCRVLSPEILTVACE
jgi:hypothetical protein